MKIALYIENGLHQIVLTPENDFERPLVETLLTAQEFKVYKGGFYACAGGWTRGEKSPDSIMIIAKRTKDDDE